MYFIADLQITDALELANDVIRIKGAVTLTHPDGLYKMSDCVHDPVSKMVSSFVTVPVMLRGDIFLWILHGILFSFDILC